GIFIKNAGIIDIEPHAVANGELVDSIVLVDGLKNLWKNFKFQKKEVNLGLSNTKLVIKEIELPVTEDKEIENALKYQIEDYLPILKENLVFDYYVIEKKSGASKVMIIGALKNMIDNYIEAVQSAGLIINSIDLNCFAFYRAVNYVNNFKNLRLSGSNKSFCLVYYGQEVSIVEFADENELRNPRFLNISVNNYIENLGRKINTSNEELLRIIKEFDFEKLLIKETKKKAELSSIQKEIINEAVPTENKISGSVLHADEEFKKTIEESINSGLDSFKTTVSGPVSDLQEVKEVENLAEIRDSLKISANQLVNEITRSIDHFLQENRSINIEKILISGEQLINMDKYIEKNSKLPVERIDISKMVPADLFKKNAAFKADDLSDINSRLIIGSGLALRGIK
ncbi:MAG: pilus assembly protein PilM, partial [Candidatus Humimicrobiaceae bacterium]